MENLQSAIKTIEEKIIDMAHLQELPHDVFRDESYESVIGMQKAISASPDLIKPYSNFYTACKNALSIHSDKHIIASNYQLVQSHIEETTAKISKAKHAYQLAEQDLQQSENAYKQMITNHSVSLLSGVDFESDSIDLAALNKTATQQRMKNAYNAETLLILKRNALKTILHNILTQAGELYYQEVFNNFQVKLNDFTAEFNKLKAALTLVNMSSKDKNPINKIIEDLSLNASKAHNFALRNAINDSLVVDGGDVDLINYINQQYEYNLTDSCNENADDVSICKKSMDSKRTPPKKPYVDKRLFSDPAIERDFGSLGIPVEAPTCSILSYHVRH